MTEFLYANAVTANNGCLSPANAQGATDGVFTTNDGNSENWNCRWGMDNPSRDLEGVQRVTFTIRNNAAGGNGPVEFIAHLYEGSTEIAQIGNTLLGTDASTTFTTPTFDVSAVTNFNNIEIRCQADGPGGMPSGRRSIQVDSIRFEAELVAPPVDVPTDLTLSQISADVLAEWTSAEAEFRLQRQEAGVGEPTWDDVILGTPIPDNASRGTAFSNDGAWLAVCLNSNSSTTDRSFRVYSVSDWSYVAGIVGTGFITCTDVDFSPDDSLMALALDSTFDSYVRVYNTSTWEFIAATELLEDYVGMGVSFSPASVGALAIAYMNSPNLTVLDTSTWDSISVPSLGGSGLSVDFSPNGSFLAVGSSGGSPGPLTIIDTTDWSIAASPALSGTRSDSVAFSPDSSLLAVANGSDGVRVFNTSNWSVAQDITGLGTCFVSFTHDGAYLGIVSSTFDTVEVYATSDWGHVVDGKDPDLGTDPWLSDIAFDQNGLMAISDRSSSLSGTFRVYDPSPYGNTVDFPGILDTEFLDTTILP